MRRCLGHIQIKHFIVFCAVLFPMFACGTNTNKATPAVTASASASASVAPVVEEPWVPSAERLARLDENTGLVLIDMPQYLSRFYLMVKTLSSTIALGVYRGARLEIVVPLHQHLEVSINALGYKYFLWQGRLTTTDRFVSKRWPLDLLETPFSFGYTALDLPLESGVIMESPMRGTPKPSMFDMVQQYVVGYAGVHSKYPWVDAGWFVDFEGVVWNFGVNPETDIFEYNRLAKIQPKIFEHYAQMVKSASDNASEIDSEDFDPTRGFRLRMHPEPSTRHILGEPFVVLDHTRKDYSKRRNAASEEIVKWMLAVYIDCDLHPWGPVPTYSPGDR